MENKICTQCGIQYKPRKQSRHVTKTPFCSIICYGKWQRGKSFIDQNKPKKPRKICSFEECGVVHFGKGYCRKHYIRFIVGRAARADRGVPAPGQKKRSSRPIYKCKHCGGEFSAYHKNPKFCSFKCMGLFNRKPFIIKKGYKKLLIPNHPRADKKGYVFEHIIIVESFLNRPLNIWEECHHKDKNRLNNSPDNLTVCKDHSEHMELHALP